LLSRIGRSNALNFFYVSHSSATRFIRVGAKYYIYVVDDLLLFSTVKEFSKSANMATPRFRHSVYMDFFPHRVHQVSQNVTDINVSIDRAVVSES